MKSKKITAILLALVLVFCSVVTAFADEATSYTGKATNKNISYDYSFNYSDDYLIYGNNEMYYSELAKMCVIASNAQFSDASGDDYTYGSAFFRDLGFCDILTGMQAPELASEKFDVKNDLTISHKLVTKGDNKYELIFVASSGTGNYSEWTSNADMGAETEAYINVLRERFDTLNESVPTTLEALTPHWTDHSMHKGFCVTANLCKETIDSYISEFVSADAQKIILITGGSRAGAVANILGAFYEDDANYKSFTYTFGAPNVTTAGDAASYKTIFNIVNEEDLITKIPMSTIGFKRFGTDLVASGNNAFADAYKTATGIDYTCDASGINNGYAFLNGLVSSREDYYEIKDDADHTAAFTPSFKALDTLNLITLPKITMLHCANFGGLFNWSVQDSKGLYTMMVTYSPAYLTTVIISVANNSEVLNKNSYALAGYISEYMPINTTVLYQLGTLAGVIKDGSLVKAHTTPIYYVMAQSDFGYDQSTFLPENLDQLGISQMIQASVFGQPGTFIIFGAGVVVGAVAVALVKKKKAQ